jgi:hypothetical protein
MHLKQCFSAACVVLLLVFSILPPLAIASMPLTPRPTRAARYNVCSLHRWDFARPVALEALGSAHMQNVPQRASIGVHNEAGRQGTFYLLYLLACASQYR